MVLGKMARKDCIRYLTMSISDGGMGFSGTTVTQFLFDLEETVAMREYMRGSEFLTKKNPQAVAHAANWIKDDIPFGFSTTVSGRLETVVFDVLLGKSDTVEAEKIFQTKVQEAGLGLQPRQAKKLSRKLKILL
jgi:hypothetical protein